MPQKSKTYKEKYHAICRSLLNTYNQITTNQCNLTTQEVHTKTINQQKNWKQITQNTFINTQGIQIIIDPCDTLQHLIQKIIIADIHTPNQTSAPNATCQNLIEIFETIDSELPLFE